MSIQSLAIKQNIYQIYYYIGFDEVYFLVLLNALMPKTFLLSFYILLLYS